MNVLVSSYDYRLVALSVVIAILAAYAALDLAGRVTSARSQIRFVWLTGGSLAMGIGIWSMHYIGMLAFHLPIPVLYDWPTVLLSLLAAVFASAIALFVVSREKMGLLRASIGSIFMGGGIATMHYTGMAAMRLSAMCQWSPSLVVISVVVAVVISFVALLLTFYFRGDLSAWSWVKISSAVVMGAAIAIMHYTGMAAATFVSTTSPLTLSDTAHAVSVSSLSIAGIIVVTFLVLGIAVLTSLAGRRFSAQAVELEASARLAAIVESSDDAIIGKSLDGIILSWNSGAERMFGYSAQEALGRPMLMLIPFERRTREEPDILARIARGERVNNFETVRIRKDGRGVNVSVTISPMKDSQGRIVGASNIARDITERKVAEKRAIEQLARLSLLNQITQAIGGREDLGSIYRVVLHSLEEDLGFDLGCFCDYEATSGGLTVLHVSVRSQALALELALTEQAHIPIDANGLSRCVRGQFVYEPDITEVKLPFPQKLAAAGLRSFVAAPLLIDNKVFGVFVAARQARESFSSGECEFLQQLSEHIALAAHQAQLYASLQEAYDDLRQTQQAVMQQERFRALGQMASGIAHDINNALSPMGLSTEMLLEDESDLSPRTRKHLEMIQRATDDVAQTVARLTEFYRQRQLQMTLSPIHINSLVQQVADLTRARWSDIPLRQGVVIEMHKEFELDPPAIMGVDSEIREALINLIFNAVDAMPSGGVLTLRTRIVERSLGPKLRRVVVEVADSGVGMDEDTRRRCLEPFFTTKGERGTGLGLAMVYGTVQRHSADIEIESMAGKGTTVRLTFAVPVGVATDFAPETPRPMPSRFRILVVDDDPLVIRVLCDSLEKDGHDVITANGGEAGIDAFSAAQRQGKPFAVVITDLGMPRVDGRKVASFVKSASESTPVILLTGWGQSLIAESDVSPHVDLVLSKPPKLRDLREALRSVVPHRPDN